MISEQKVETNKIKKKKLYLILYNVFRVITFIGVGLFIFEVVHSSLFFIIPMVFFLIFFSLYNDIKEKERDKEERKRKIEEKE